MDVGVMLYDSFLVEYPEGKTSADFGNRDVDYSYLQFKNELEEALVDRFDRAAVKRGNKAFNIRENTYHVRGRRGAALRVPAVLGERKLSGWCRSRDRSRQAD